MRNTAVERCRCGGRPGGRGRGRAGARLQIAVGVLHDAATGRILIARRRSGTAHAGLWEFPGGKQGPGENSAQALRRELREELGVDACAIEPLLCVDHDYADLGVRLHVWRVAAWHGDAHGREGQQVEWLPLPQLRAREFPAANRAIVNTLLLPPLYLITPDLARYDEAFFAAAATVLAAGVRLLQFRSRRLAPELRTGVIARLAELCRRHDTALLVNGSATEVLSTEAAGLHLSAARLLQASTRPLDDRFLLGASCHNRSELDHARHLSADLAVLGPVRRSRTHPDAAPLGWRGFRGMVAAAGLPVYALGGMLPAHLASARRNGAQGLAMISGIWSAADPAAAVAACDAD